MDVSTQKWNHRESIAHWMLSESESIIVSGHKDPDQDSYGSQLATYLILKNHFPSKEVVLLVDDSSIDIYDRYVDIYNVNNDENALYVSDECERFDTSYDLFLGVDCSSLSRLPEFSEGIAKRAKNQFYFDHHEIQEDERRLNVLNDPSSASCTSLIFRYFNSRHYLIPDEAYTPLYIGLLGDTGNFRNSNTNANSFKLARKFASKMKNSPSGISRLTFSRTAQEFSSIANVYNNYVIENDGNLVYYRYDNYDEIAKNFSSTNNPIDILTQLRDYDIAMTAIMTKIGKYRVSLRSSGMYRVDTYASSYGGGGHQLASGCLCNTYELDELINTLREDTDDNF